MTQNSIGFSAEDIALFLDELDELLQVIDTGLLTLEAAANAAGPPGAAVQPAIEQIFRAAHTIKGSSATIGFRAMAELTHALESVLEGIRQRQDEVSTLSSANGSGLTDLLFQCLDSLREMRSAFDPERLDTPLSSAQAALVARLSAGHASTRPGTGLALPQVGAKAPQGGASGLEIVVEIAAECLMPAVRAYQAFMALLTLDPALVSEPTIADIQREQIGRQIRFRLAGGTPIERVREALVPVPEVQWAEPQAAVASEQQAPPDPQPEVASEPPPASDPQPVPAGGSGGLDQASPGESPTPPPQQADRMTAGDTLANDQTVRIPIGLLDSLMSLVGELVVDRTRLFHTVERSRLTNGAIRDELDSVTHHLGRITSELQDQVMRARMVPVDVVFRRFPRLVRDLSKSLGKEVQLEIEGRETELDRSIIEHIGDPLIHLIRNALDHGIEPPDERQRAGKPPRGALRLAAQHEEGRIILTIQDDGRGIDPARILASARQKGLLTAEEAKEVTETQALELIFRAGFSTAEEVTDVSGRGVGMDVVRRNIERIGGQVTLRTAPGAGTAFRIELPLTLAIIHSLLVRSGGSIYAIPLTYVAEVRRCEESEIHELPEGAAIVWRERVVPIRRMEAALAGGLDYVQPQPGDLAVVLRAGDQHLGILAEQLIGEQETVIQNLSAMAGAGRGLAGAAILGLGEIAFILDVPTVLSDGRQVGGL